MAEAQNRELSSKLADYNAVLNYSNTAHEELKRLVRKYGPRDGWSSRQCEGEKAEHPYHRHYNYFDAADRHGFEPRAAVQGGTGGLEKK